MRVAALPTPVEIDLAALDVARRRELDQSAPELVHAPTQERSTPVPSSEVRLSALDAARILATFGIIWTHVAEAQGIPVFAGTLGRFGTSFYIIAAALFIVRGALKPARRSWTEDTKRRAARILLPFLTWSLIYGAYYGHLGFRAGSSLKSITFWWGPVAGTAIHLWFLPFIFFWGALGAWAAPKLMRLPVHVLMLGGLALSAFCYYVAYDYVFFAVNRYWLWDYHLHRLDRWIVEVPLFVAALVGGVCFHRLPERARSWVRQHLPSLAMCAGALFLVSQYLYGAHIEFIRDTTRTEGRFMANIAGLSLLCALLCLGSSSSRAAGIFARLAPIGKYTYLAFLCHMLVLEFLRGPLHGLPGYGSIPTAVFSTLIVFALSIQVSRLVSRTPWLSWLKP